MPAGEWVCLDALTAAEPDGLGMADTMLWDELRPDRPRLPDAADRRALSGGVSRRSRRRREVHAITAAALRLIHRGVGTGDERVRVLAAVPLRDPAGDRDPGRGVGADPLDDRRGVAEAGAREQQRELLAAVAGDQVHLADLTGPARGRLLQQAVAGSMAVDGR